MGEKVKQILRDIEYLLYVLIWFSLPVYVLDLIEKDIGESFNYMWVYKGVWLVICFKLGISLKRSMENQK